MKTLVPCTGCARHVRASESACPFCGHSIESDATARAVPSAKTRLTRAALFAFGTTLAATAAACGGGTPTNDAASDVQSADTMEQDSSNMALYGAPVVDVPDPDASEGSPGARYGAPPVNDV